MSRSDARDMVQGVLLIVDITLVTVLLRWLVQTLSH